MYRRTNTSSSTLQPRISGLVKMTLAVLLIAALVAVTETTYARQDLPTNAFKALDDTAPVDNNLAANRLGRADGALPRYVLEPMVAPVLSLQSHIPVASDVCDVKLFWVADETSQNIIIERRALVDDDIVNGGWKVIAIVPSGAPLYNDSVSISGAIYYYRARTERGVELSDYSAVVTVETLR